LLVQLPSQKEADLRKKFLNNNISDKNRQVYILIFEQFMQRQVSDLSLLFYSIVSSVLLYSLFHLTPFAFN